MAAIGLATVTGNGAVLVALTKAKRAPSHYPLASLAAADLLVGLFVLPIGAARELFVLHLNRVICSCWSTLDVLCCTASILSLCVLGWERWCGITAPLSRAKRTKHAKILAAMVWPVSTLVALPTGFIPSQRHFLPGETPRACSINTNVGYVFFSTISSFYLPSCVMVFLYVRILNALSIPPTIRSHRGRSPVASNTENLPVTPNKKVSKTDPQLYIKDKIKKVVVFMSPKGCHLNVPGATPGDKPSPIKNLISVRSLLSRQCKATRTIVTLMLLFLVCWTPFFVMLPLGSVCECIPDVAWECCTWIGYVNSALNPIVYAAATPSVRRALFTSIRTNKTNRPSNIPMTSSRSS